MDIVAYEDGAGGGDNITATQIVTMNIGVMD